MTHPEGLLLRLVLDRSAVLAYVEGSVHVAETVHEVIHDGVGYAVPAVVGAEALAELHDPKAREKAQWLLSLDACRVLSTGDDWMELAYWREFTGRIDRAVAVIAGLDYRAPILTSELEHYSSEDVALNVISFEH